jgi:integrase
MFETIVQILILTGLRRSEVSALHRDWFEGDALTLPDTITKNQRNCTVPVPSTVLVLVQQYPDQFFENDKGMTFCGWGKAKACFDKRLEGVEPFTLHDLRRTYSSVHTQLGTPIHIVEKLLNHVSGSFAGVYNRYSYMDEMKKAVPRYEEWIQSKVLRQV